VGEILSFGVRVLGCHRLSGPGPRREARWMGSYVARRTLNYVILLFIAVSLSYLLAATALHPRQLYAIINPPLPPESIENSLREKNLSDQVPLFQRYWTWLTNIILHWDWGQAPKGGSVNAEVSRRMWV